MRGQGGRTTYIAMINYNRNVNVNHISALISKLNGQKKYHVGYVGDNEGEIRDSNLEEFSGQEQQEKLFTLAYKENRLMGVLGFNADFEQKVAEILGSLCPWNKGRLHAHSIGTLECRHSKNKWRNHRISWIL